MKALGGRPGEASGEREIGIFITPEEPVTQREVGLVVSFFHFFQRTFCD
jgi:hypothetical protein